MTLFRDNKHSEYEDKEWIFVIEDVGQFSTDFEFSLVVIYIYNIYLKVLKTRIKDTD